MAFTNAWSDVIPAGGTQAKLIDDHIRQLRLDLHERLNAVLTQDWTADPLVLLDIISGKKNDKKLTLPYSAFVKEPLGKEIYYDADKLIVFTDSAPIKCPIVLPPGVTLKRVELMNDINDSGGVTMDIRKRPFAAGAPVDESTLIATVTNVGAGRVISAPADFAEV